MPRRFILTLLLAMGLLTAVATSSAASADTVNMGGNTALGNFLVGTDDMTLYLFLNDEPGTSNCAGGCAVNWPPLLVADGVTPTAGPGVPGTLGTIMRDDGGRQVTYNGWPLYFWKNDSAAGDATGQNVGSKWFVVKTDDVVLSGSSLGSYLVGNNAMTLYYFTKDTRASGISVCNGGCAAAWPPLLVEPGAVPTAGAGVLGTIDVITRDDGMLQATYNGWPLYFWASDVKPGDTLGNNVGTVWFTVAPDFAPNDFQKMLNRQSANERLIQILQTVEGSLTPALKTEFDGIRSSYTDVVNGTSDLITWQSGG